MQLVSPQHKLWGGRVPPVPNGLTPLDISLSRTEPFGTRDTASEFGTVPKKSGQLATLVAMFTSLFTSHTDAKRRLVHIVCTVHA